MSNPAASTTSQISETALPGADFGFLRTPLIIAIATIMGIGIFQGILTGRWIVQQDLIEQGEKLQALPNEMGPWLLQEDLGLDNTAESMLQCHGSSVRRYQHQTKGISVTVAALFGPRGPIAVHTPEICYNSIGTEQAGPRQDKTIRTDGTSQELWRVQFKPEGSPTPSMDIWYAWSDGGDFVAAERPRFWMTNSLYKIQLAGPTGTEAFDPCEDFLEHFLPELGKLIE